MDAVLELIFGSPWQLTAAVAVYGLCAATYRDLWKHEPARKRWIGYLIQNSWSRRYREILRHILDWIDARLTPEIAEEGWDPHERRSAWSYSLLNFSLFTAFCYPTIALMLAWALSGEDRRIGDWVLLAAEPDPLKRAAEVMLLVGYAVLLCFLARRPRTSMTTALIAGMCLPLPYLFAVDLIRDLDARSMGFEVTVVTMLFFFIFVVMYLGPARIFRFAHQSIGYFTERKATVLFALMALVIPGVIFQPAAPPPEWPPDYMVTAEDAALFDRIDAIFAYMDSMFATALILASVLPVFNAATDFLSSGLTRYLMRRGLSGQMALTALIDIAGAAAIFCLFIVGLMALLAAMPLMSGARMIDLGAVFADIRARPDDYWWLYVTFISTLLPTLMHLALAAFGTVIQGWEGLRRYIVEGLVAAGEGDEVRGRWATRALTLAMTAGVMAPVLLVGLMVEHRGNLGLVLLGLFERVAQALGLV